MLRGRLVDRRLLRVLALAWAVATAMAPAACGAAAGSSKLGQIVVEADAHISPTAPALVIERPEIERAGRRTLGEFLQRLPMHGNASNALYSSGTDGASRMDLRNLGPQRTLVVIDQHRMVPLLGGGYDLTTLPLSAVERIEVLTGAAALAYGSGAVSGAIRLVLREAGSSDEVSLGHGRTDSHDGRESFGSLLLTRETMGTEFIAALAYHDSDPIEATARDVSSTPLHGFPAELTGPRGTASPWGLFRTARGTLTLDRNSPGCLPDQSCNRAADGFRPVDTARDGFNGQAAKYLRIPVRQRSASIALLHPAADFDVHAYGLVSERTSARRASLPSITVIPSPASIYYPFDDAIHEFVYLPVGKFFHEHNDVETLYFAAGVDGTASDWKFSSDFTFGNSRQSGVRENVYNIGRLRAALGPSFIDSAGSPRCGMTAAPIVDCVPMNLAGGPSGLTPTMLDGVLTTQTDPGRSTMTEFHLDARRAVGQDESATLQLGARARYESAHGNPTPHVYAQDALLNQDTEFHFRPRTPHRGRTSAFEASAALSGKLADPVGYHVGAGWHDYHPGGGLGVYSAELEWRPTAAVTVALRQASAPRAPAVSELAAETRTYPEGVGDPCSQLPLMEEFVRQRCRDGFGSQPALQHLAPQTRAADITIGGNPDLLTEKTRTRTASVDFRAQSGLSLRADWYEIVIRNPIAAVNPSELPVDCYAAGVVSACERFVRNSTGAIATVDARLGNVGTGLRVSGVDVTVRQRKEFESGVLSLAGTLAYMSYFGDYVVPEPFTTARFRSQRPRGNRVATYLNRETALPRRKALVRADWLADGYSLSLVGRYVSSMRESCLRLFIRDMDSVCELPPDATTGPRSHRIDATWYLDAEVGFRLGSAEINLGIDNVTGRGPPLAPTTLDNSFDPSYEVPGRFFYVDATWRF